MTERKPIEKLEEYGPQHYLVYPLGNGRYRIREVKEYWGRKHVRSVDNEEIIVSDFYVLKDGHDREWGHLIPEKRWILDIDIESVAYIYPNVLKKDLLESMIRGRLNDWVI